MQMLHCVGVGVKAMPLSGPSKCRRVWLCQIEWVVELKEKTVRKQSRCISLWRVNCFYRAHVFLCLIPIKRISTSITRTITGWQEILMTSSVSFLDLKKSHCSQVQSCKIYSKEVLFLRHHSPQFQIHFHNHPRWWLWPFLQLFWSNIFFLHFMDQSKSHCPHEGLIEFIYPPRDNRWCLLIRAWCLVSIPCPRPRVGGSAGHTGRSYGRTVDPTPLIRWGTSGGRTAAAAGWGDWPADAPPPSPRPSVSWKKTAGKN